MMAVSPVLVIKVVGDSAVGVRARLYDDFVEHEIVLNSVLAYWWANHLPPVVKFIELFESVIKRTVNELMPHKYLKIKYEVKADDDLEKAVIPIIPMGKLIQPQDIAETILFLASEKITGNEIFLIFIFRTIRLWFYDFLKKLYLCVRYL